MSRYSASIGLAILAMAGMLLLPAGPATAKGGPPESAPPPNVTVSEVPEMEVNPAAEFVGRVEAIQTVDLRARVEGYITKVSFTEGGAVKKGDLLIQLEQAPYQSRVNEAKAQVALAQATLDKALRYIKRLKSVRSGGVAATDMDNALSAEETGRAQLQQAKANLQQAELNLGYTTITAPIGGVMGRAQYTLGNLVGPTSGALARLVQLNPIRVVYSVSENEYVTVRMKAGDHPEQIPAELVPRLKLPDGQMYPQAGRLDFTEPQVDPGTGTIAMRAIFSNPHQVLLPGQYVTVFISRRKPRRMPVVPQAAVLEDRQGLYVLVVDKNDKAQRRGIVRGAPLGTGWAVESGLKPGETIIVHGLQRAVPGQTVRPVRAAGQ
ncbi:MAG: efflux RND transporter periplasmic adaptor subunit [Desulfarculaceae bacterium]|nr:efflux RND transporter periplasmic adaptor subunit [Desulfarculaceae bacterium]MCF8049314.1 efflux RND transporter periplasmic adaptor subunit [Desulfarculaceae bacterium]MCF8065560.1 efflux RND transporter periplasmic adaptor subunit [Desulfarculaceae bacterium]MCF8123484.1 efflux RND transporter periplasmic adaptor subunit [Desulfarculaceae bacterium]